MTSRLLDLKVLLIVVVLISVIFLYFHFITKKTMSTIETDIKLNVSSTVFDDNGIIPAKYSCEGANINPAIEISNIPSSVKSLTLTVTDLDTPNQFVHWLAWNIKASGDSVRIDENLNPDNIIQGLNDFGKVGYGGPCPPAGQTHRYSFQIYGLNVDKIDLASSSKISDLNNAIKPSTIAKGELIGQFTKSTSNLSEI